MQNSKFSPSQCGVSPPPNRDANASQKTEPSLGLSQTTVKVTMQSTSSLMNVLVTVSRIGAQINFVSAKDSTAILTVSARPNVVRRVPSLLRELVEVIDVCGI